MAGRRWKVFGASLIVAVALGLWTDRAAVCGGFVAPQVVADQGPPSPSRGSGHREGTLRIEVVPGDVEIYLDDQYLGRADELVGRPIEGIVPGNRLLELRRGADRTFLQIVVPPDGGKTIRVDLTAPAPRGSPSSPSRPRPDEERTPSSTSQVPAPSMTPGTTP